MALDVAAARAAVDQAALARDEGALRALADALPAVTAFGYERHRARAFANAIRGARDSAVAELCLGVAACAPAASTFVADSAQIRLLTGEPVPLPSTEAADRRREPVSARPILAVAAVAAAVAALVVLPKRSLDEARPEASGITAPTRTAAPRTVVADPPKPRTSPERGRTRVGVGADSTAAVLVAARPAARAAAAAPAARPPLAEPPPPRAAVSRRAPRPAPASEPSPPSPAPAPGPATATPAPAPAPTAGPVAAVPAAAPQPREPKGKAAGRASAPGQTKKAAAPPSAPVAPAAPAATAAPAEPPAPPEPHPEQARGRDTTHGRDP